MKLVLLGVGGIGASIAAHVVRSGLPVDLVLVDPRPGLAASHVMDLEAVVGLGGTLSVRSGQPVDANDADIVVVSASVPLRPNTSRSIFLAENAAILDDVARPLTTAGFSGILLLLTNPVDVLLTVLARTSGLATDQLIGYSLNDSLRLRYAIGRSIGVPSAQVQAWCLGEHGDRQVPIFSRVTLNGRPLSLTPTQRNEVEDYIGSWYVRHESLKAGRTSTWASGFGAAEMIAQIIANDPTPLPASVVLSGQYGVHDLALTVPVVISGGRLRAIEEWALEADEAAGFVRAGAHVALLADEIAEPVARPPR